MSDAYLPGDTRQRIQDLIKDRKITQAELAENVGLSNSALWAHGKTIPYEPSLWSPLCYPDSLTILFIFRNIPL